jgi:hypothetical protein
MRDISPEHLTRLDRLARSAINHWGEDKQLDQATEETAELLCELTKRHRNRQDWEHILEESVDTYIMMTELFIMFGPEAVNAMFAKKLDKFEAGLSKSIQAKVDSILSINI